MCTVATGYSRLGFILSYSRSRITIEIIFNYIPLLISTDVGNATYFANFGGIITLTRPWMAHRLQIGALRNGHTKASQRS